MALKHKSVVTFSLTEITNEKLNWSFICEIWQENELLTYLHILYEMWKSTNMNVVRCEGD